ncbi:conserved hypothetical protein [Verticillium alfalfae VaMs.102]|uniref:Uncharacterized protein n=1 Tax=Verticillium alfalfae (strain VaMs.102 / ATCC MYA-4576 / FGSC 10136) TaxID=526221 RepID=C9SWD3_VERA1|nr:conserved hypothetical protein [Verticillium alfalfae VaMs.102]EEY23098.1 conserved hypothetical protein [Verticillium alfalfae VaMs.102]
MRPIIPLLVSVTFLTAQAFEFTGPDPSQKINLTQPVEITWTLDSSFSEPLARAFNLWFYAVFSGGGGTGGWEIRSNLSLSSTSYTWNPRSIVDGLISNGNLIVPGEEHYFSAQLVGADGQKLAEVQSENYALEGYDFIRNGGPCVRAEVAAVGVMAGLVIAGGMML